MEPAGFHIACQHKGAKNTGNHMEPSKKMRFCSKNGLFHQAGPKQKKQKQKQKQKMELARFHIACQHKGVKNTGNHMELIKKCTSVQKMINFTKRAKNLKMGTN